MKNFAVIVVSCFTLLWAPGVIKRVGGLFILLCVSLPAWSQATFVEPGHFKVFKPCHAYTSIRKETGAVGLEVNRVYLAYGENRPVNASHTQIDVVGKRKWVSLECGGYTGKKPSFQSHTGDSVPKSGGEGECLPFFDDKENRVIVGVGGRVDVTPVAPEIEPFGAAVNKLCGAPGKRTGRDEFKQLLNEHPDVLSRLMAYTGGRVFANRPARHETDAYLKELAEAWYAVRAFDHIFCGEPQSSNALGGLHYHGRYQQLQASGEACRLSNFQRNEVVPGSIYTIGVKMKRSDGGWAAFATKGYGLTLSAEEILKVGTRAFVENPAERDNSEACILDVRDGDTGFKSVFVRCARGIRTFYPDATPDIVRNPPCASPANLP